MTEKQTILEDIRNIPHATKLLLLAGTISVIEALSSCNQSSDEKKFGNEHYIDISGNVVEPYVDRDVLLEEMPTAYDNLFYAQGIHGMSDIERSGIYKICNNIDQYTAQIRAATSKRGVPEDKFIGDFMVESAGGLQCGKNKSLDYNYNCYGPEQISVLMGKAYGIIKQVEKTQLVQKKDKKGRVVKNKKGKPVFVNKKVLVREDKRDDFAASFDVACHILADMHQNYISAGYTDDDWSLTFASYHMGETNMRRILRIAQNVLGKKPSTMHDIIAINDKKLGVAFITLLDQSYKYYPKVLAASRIYHTYKNHRKDFEANIEKFMISPITRRLDLAEEYVWYGEKGTNTGAHYYTDSAAMVQAMSSDEIFGLLKSNNDVKYSPNVGEYTKYADNKELMKMTSKASRGLIKFLSYHCPFDIKLSSLTRSEQYNTEGVYGHKRGGKKKNKKWKKGSGKWTSHATGRALDIGFPANGENKMYLKWILYGQEVQGRIAFLEEGQCYHIIINPKFEEFFEDIVDEKIPLGSGDNSGAKDSVKQTTKVDNMKINVGGFEFLGQIAEKGDTSYIYEYTIKSGGIPKSVRTVFKNSFKAFSGNTIEIIDAAGNPYAEDKSFTKGEKIYTKVHIHKKK